ncbi:hypothetical protein PLESTM_001942100 [Pleodorina starrii]|nr:hypothetical protein PLESTM_001942100 [Pleodorina starrii]
MARCSAHAERLSRETGERVRVVGWYHSHPHITVLPSHVDVRTQAMYQLLDPGFVGLIVSTFNRDAASQAGTVQLTAFQSLPEGGEAGGGGGGPVGPLVRKEVAVAVVPSLTRLEKSFSDVRAVQSTLMIEETEVYQRALAVAAATMAAAGGSTGASPGSFLELTEVHHAGVYQAQMVRLVEASLRPTLTSLATLLNQQRTQQQQLEEQVRQLEARLARASGGCVAAGKAGLAAVDGEEAAVVAVGQ